MTALIFEFRAEKFTFLELPKIPYFIYTKALKEKGALYALFARIQMKSHAPRVLTTALSQYFNFKAKHLDLIDDYYFHTYLCINVILTEPRAIL